ncbi:MAG: ATP synthase F0 subunit C [Pyrinomonadaceae bacterium MAG19_C2-C3]|nr:ATP synthase F0 subunit C [Pyrinomonadaceae bacterium MAG19_C2-C3]
MNNLRKVFFALVGVLAWASVATAQGLEAAGGGVVSADNAFSVSKYVAIAAGIGFALAAGLGAIGQGRIGAAAVEGAARNPGAAGRIQTIMILGLVFIESLVIFTLVIMFAIVNAQG